VALLALGVVADVDDSAVVPLFAAAAGVSAAMTYLLASRAGEPPARWAIGAAVAGVAWFGLLLLALWLVAIWVFDPD
jgi:hypothetical protein